MFPYKTLSRTYLYILVAFLLLSVPALAQDNKTLEGRVYEQWPGAKALPLPAALVRWQDSSIAVRTDDSGRFSIALPGRLPRNLIISSMTFRNDTILVTSGRPLKITMSDSKYGAQVEVIGEGSGVYMDRMKAPAVEIVTKKELLRAACCNLSESFETNASVDVNFPDALSGAKQIRMLGLEGAYTPILVENMPAIRGLSSGAGLSNIPGTWVESIQISKGAGSVVNGYESIAGQINLELEKPSEANPLFLNVYGDAMGRGEVNLHLAHRFSDTLSTLLLLHGDAIAMKVDRNKDGFLDNPLTRQLGFSNRWQYFDGKKWESQFGGGFNRQYRQGGQFAYVPSEDRGTQNAYGTELNNTRYDVYAKLGRIYMDKPYKSFGSQYSFSQFEQDNRYGLRRYQGVQRNGYANFIYQSIISNTFHKIKGGASFMYDEYREKLFAKNFSNLDTTFHRTELVPGAFAEYTYNPGDKLTAVAGLRADYHNMFGFMVTPRVHLRYAPWKNTTFRASVGKGYRTPNPWVEFASIWVTSREVIIREAPQQEKAWNMGGSLMQEFRLARKNAVLTMDFFRTEFQNQYIADMDQDIHKVVLYNLKGRSYANSFQAELSYSPIKNLELKTAYKLYDVKVTYHDRLLEKPLLPRSRFLATAGYSTKHKKWVADLTALHYGTARLPNQGSGISEDQAHLQRSDPYWIFHMQITRNFKRWSVYAGSENLLNYMQPDPIMAANDPFSRDFDASMIWGPVEGRRIYAGIRFKLANSN